MTDVIEQAAVLLSAAGVLLGLAVTVATGRLLAGLPVFLEFLLAAGVLRLTLLDTWVAIATVAVLVLVRKVAVAGIRSAAAAG